MPTSEQIEAAAKALYDYTWDSEKSLDGATHGTQDFYRRRARAALEAAEALEEVEWAIRARGALIPAVSEGHAKGMLSDIRYNTGHVVYRTAPGPWIALEGETDHA